MVVDVGFALCANAHLSDDKTVAKMGHPILMVGAGLWMVTPCLIQLLSWSGRRMGAAKPEFALHQPCIHSLFTASTYGFGLHGPF